MVGEHDASVADLFGIRALPAVVKVDSDWRIAAYAYPATWDDVAQLVCRLSNAVTLRSCPTANRACAKVPVSTAAHPRVASDSASPNGVPTVNVFPRRHTSRDDERGEGTVLNGLLAYLSCVVAACALMLELRVVRHLTAETKSLDAVFR